MAGEKGIEFNGIQIKRGDGSTPTEAFNLVGRITSVDGLGGGSAAVIDVSAAEDTFKEKLMGMADEGQLSLSGQYIPTDAQQQGMQDDRANRVRRNFEITFTDDPASKAAFTAYVLTFAVSGSLDDKMTFATSLEITGGITWTAGA